MGESVVLSEAELAEFRRLLPLYLLYSAQVEHRSSWEYRPTEELTTRDLQAMWNFSNEGICLETIAQQFRCSIAFVSETVMKRPWLSARKKALDLGRTATGRTWWESDHSDPLELVRLYYPEYLDARLTLETCAKEKKQKATIDVEAYLEGFGPGFVTDANVRTVKEVLASIEALHEQERGPDAELDIEEVKEMLDRVLVAS